MDLLHAYVLSYASANCIMLAYMLLHRGICTFGALLIKLWCLKHACRQKATIGVKGLSAMLLSTRALQLIAVKLTLSFDGTNYNDC